MRLIDLLNEIANGGLIPTKIICNGKKWQCDYYKSGPDYKEIESGELLFANLSTNDLDMPYIPINGEIILPIPDNELYTIDNSELKKQDIDFNFRVLQEKINEIIEVINNEYNK